MSTTPPFTTPGYRNGDTAACEKCSKPVQVKFFSKGQVVVLSPKEQSEIALRCQACGAVVCDECAHPVTSIFPVCPMCQREWGPYYFSDEDRGNFDGQERRTQPAAWTPAMGHVPMTDIPVAKDVVPAPKESASKSKGDSAPKDDLRTEFGTDKVKPPLLPRIDFRFGRMVKTLLALLVLLAVLAAAVFILGPMALRQVRGWTSSASPTLPPSILTAELIGTNGLQFYAGQSVFVEGMIHSPTSPSACVDEPATSARAAGTWCTAQLSAGSLSLSIRLRQGQPINSVTPDLQFIAADGRLVPGKSKVQVTGTLLCEGEDCHIDVEMLTVILPPTPTPTLTPRPTTTPTLTATLVISPTATLTTTLEGGVLLGTEIPLGTDVSPATATLPPSILGCREATTITTADVGQTLCIEGIVLAVKKQEIDRTTKAYIYTFSPEKGAFYIVVYNYPLPDVTKGVCIRMTSQVRLLGTAPVMVPTSSELPQICP